jgi:hypothetical protein
MPSVRIELDLVPLLVIGNYYSAEKPDANYPGAPEEFEVCEVMLPDSKHDIAELLKERMGDITCLALVAYHDQQDAAKIEQRIAA